MRPLSLDHVALWVTGRDRIVAAAEESLGLRVIERTDRFTLLGDDPRRGKLTLFDAEGPRERGALARIGLRVSALNGRAPSVELGEGIEVVLVEDAGRAGSRPRPRCALLGRSGRCGAWLGAARILARR